MAGMATAFPAAILEAATRDPALAARTAEMTELINRNRLAGRQEGADSAENIFEAVPVFDAEAQYIDVSEGSGHEYVPPGPDDIRGPCPGLVSVFDIPTPMHKLTISSERIRQPQLPSPQRICQHCSVHRRYSERRRNGH